MVDLGFEFGGHHHQVMSDRRLINQIALLRPDSFLQPQRTPVLLSDSKGLRLQTQVRVNPETLIRFWCYPGATAENRLRYLTNNLHNQLVNLQRITLFVWVGTCNLTTKRSDGFIELSSEGNSAAYQLINTLKDIYHFTRTFGPDVKLVFLHLPLYSIYHSNLSHGQRDAGNFIEQDVLLHRQIKIVNNYINDTNRLLGTYTPQFSEDLLASKRNSAYSLRTKYKYKFVLYTDGVHHKPLLAKLWLARICRLIRDFCYY